MWYVRSKPLNSPSFICLALTYFISTSPPCPSLSLSLSSLFSLFLSYLNPNRGPSVSLTSSLPYYSSYLPSRPPPSVLLPLPVSQPLSPAGHTPEPFLSALRLTLPDLPRPWRGLKWVRGALGVLPQPPPLFRHGAVILLFFVSAPRQPRRLSPGNWTPHTSPTTISALHLPLVRLVTVYTSLRTFLKVVNI